MSCSVSCFAFLQGIHTAHSLRDLDRGEGAALHAHLFEEALDWSEPLRKQIKFVLQKESWLIVAYDSDRNTNRR